MKSNLQTVQAIYEAFGKGDIPTILSHLADDVKWESWENNSAQKAGVPWLKPRKDKDGVLAFFQIVGTMEFRDFRVLSLMEGGNQVAAELVLDARISDTGQILRDEEMHLWTFNEQGKVSRLRHYLDTHKHMIAAGIPA